MNDDEMTAIALGYLKGSCQRELHTCSYAPTGQTCSVVTLLSTVAASIVRIRAELAIRSPRADGLVMTRKAITARATYARNKLASELTKE